MGQFHFGPGNGKVSQREGERCDRIARKHGADFTWHTLPGMGPVYWFSGPNRGDPFDRNLARAVLAEVGEVKVSKGNRP